MLSTSIEVRDGFATNSVELAEEATDGGLGARNLGCGV